MAAPESGEVHGGVLIARRLVAHQVRHLFTLSGGHIFPIYDGARAAGIRIVDVRHESAAVFAAEGWAKVTREVGVCALTAGPGVTNGVSGVAAAQANNSPIVVLAGRAARSGWGRGALQELDHVPFMAPLTKLAVTATSTEELPALIERAFAVALAPPSGPVFVDVPLEVLYARVVDPPAPLTGLAGADRPAESRAADPDELERAAGLLAGAARPVAMAGTNLYWGRGERALLELARELEVPVYLNGLARGCIPADDERCFSRTRGAALRGADVALLIGLPMDFRLGFGGALGAETRIVAIDVAAPRREHPRPVEAGLYGDMPAILAALRERAAGLGAGEPGARARWLADLREREAALRDAERAELGDGRAPLHPLRVYGELTRLLDRDAIVIGDGGDFVSFAGRVLDSFQPGCWLDPGPFGCLGSGPGYALAAKLARPERQVVLLLGDGAAGFSLMEFDTLVRHCVDVVAVVGNNGIWGLEKHPMEMLYGYSVAAELRPETRYDEVARALGGHGELVREPGELRPALARALAARTPALVNVLTDPSVAYPRRSSLA